MAHKGKIDLANITKRFGDANAVENINLSIPAGTYCCLLGPSGCGKTTILRMIAGHETPTSGDVRIDGESVIGQAPVQRGTAMMFQSYALFPHLTCLDNVAYNLKVRGIGKDERRKQAREMLAKVKMDHFADRVPAQLSGGQQQRIALARALITNPRVLLLDEPLSALDEFLRLQMRGELRRMQQELGMTFIHVTHTQMEAIAVADMVVVMDHGHIEQAGSAQEVYSAPDSAYVARFMGGQNVLSGKLNKTANGNAILVSDNGNQFQLSELGGLASKPAAERIYFSIRRDHVELIRASANQSSAGEINTVIGTVSAIEYQGTAVKVTVQGVTSEDFVAYVPDARFLADPLSRGDRVVARWAAKEARALKVGSEQTTYRGH